MNMYNTHRGEAENTKSYSTDTIVTQTTANARSCIIHSGPVPLDVRPDPVSEALVRIGLVDLIGVGHG